MGILTHDDWSLDRRGQRAQARHKEKVKRAIRENLADIVTDQGIILSDGKRTVRIPVQTLDEPHFTYDYGKQKHVGQGEGKKGQAIGKAFGSSQGGQGAGEGPGQRMLETEVSLDDIEDVLFSELRLPNLKEKQQTKEVMDSIEFTDIRKKGIRANIDRKHTLMEALRRSRSAGQRLMITEEDLRFKTWEETMRPHMGAVVIAMMDVSGSMGLTEKYLSRTFFFWMEKFLQQQYKTLDMRYLVHHTEAYETTKEEFYSTRENGGTVCSTVFQKALEVIRADYPPELWNIYPIYVGDGDNAYSDNDASLRLMRELCDLSAMAGYLEVNPYYRATSLTRILGNLNHSAFRTAVVSDKGQILRALRSFFHDGEAAVV